MSLRVPRRPTILPGHRAARRLVLLLRCYFAETCTLADYPEALADTTVTRAQYDHVKPQLEAIVSRGDRNHGFANDWSVAACWVAMIVLADVGLLSLIGSQLSAGSSQTGLPELCCASRSCPSRRRCSAASTSPTVGDSSTPQLDYQESF